MTELEVIRAASRDLLVTRWQACFDVNPPPRVLNHNENWAIFGVDHTEN